MSGILNSNKSISFEIWIDYDNVASNDIPVFELITQFNTKFNFKILFSYL